MEVDSLLRRELEYKIQACSSSSHPYMPENILNDCPNDQSSRWSSDINTPPQFITLKLEKPALVTAITFGKYEKTHVCNLKRFKVYGGLDENCLIELLDNGLKNDNKQETFGLKHQLNQHDFPISFIKIVPIQSWGPNFNFSIWYVGLYGDDTPLVVNEAVEWHKKFRETETIKMCLKHLRQQNYLEVFESLQKKTKIQLEHPILTQLHHTLVKSGDYQETEKLILKSLEDGFFNDWLSRQQPQPLWSPIILPEELVSEDAVLTPTPVTPETEEGSSELQFSGKPLSSFMCCGQPSNRGGHQMIMDNVSQTVYLFGGWDGGRDLADFWTFHIPSGKWSQLSADTEAEGGPPPRSCHKMVIDENYRQIFVLGKYLERGMRDSRSKIKSDFFVYHIDTSTWTQITDDTSEMGGPNLIFDHQMCLDPEKRNIYVFGGQSLFVNSSGEEPRGEKKFSGLFVYHIPTSSWTKLREDVTPTTGLFEAAGTQSLKARTGHSMLFHTGVRKLFIFGGQRKRDEYMDDFFTYSVDTGAVEFLANGDSGASIPAVGYTQRATIDCARNEIHVMTGLNKDKAKTRQDLDTRVSNSFWVYYIQEKRWACIYKNVNTSLVYWNKRQALEPRPRYAHQLAYHQVTATHYMFGGNPGGKEGKEGKVRLGDFWKLALERPSSYTLERQCRLMIRKTKFRELNCDSSALEALTYLQTELSDCVDHQSNQEEKGFQLLAGELFKSTETTGQRKLRVELFDQLVGFYPEDMAEPPGNLKDLVPWERPSRPRCQQMWPSQENNT